MISRLLSAGCPKILCSGTTSARRFLRKETPGGAHPVRGSDQISSRLSASQITLAQIYLQNREFGKAVQMSQEVLVYDAMNVPARLLRSRALIGWAK